MDPSASFLPSSLDFSPSFLNRSEKEGVQNLLLLDSARFKQGGDSNSEHQNFIEKEESFLRLFKDQLNQERSQKSSLKPQDNQKALHVFNPKGPFEMKNAVKKQVLEGVEGALDLLDLSRIKEELEKDHHLKDLKNLGLENLEDLKNLKDLVDEQGEYSFFMAKGGGFVDYLDRKLELKPWQVVIFSNQWNQLEKEGLKDLKDLSYEKWNQIMDSMALSAKQKNLAERFLEEFENFSEQAKNQFDSMKRKFSVPFRPSIGGIGELNKNLSLDDSFQNHRLQDLNPSSSELKNVKEDQENRFSSLPSGPLLEKRNFRLKNPLDLSPLKGPHFNQSFSSTKVALEDKGHLPLPAMEKNFNSLNLKGEILGQKGQKFDSGESFLNSKDQNSLRFPSQFNEGPFVQTTEVSSFDGLKTASLGFKENEEFSSQLDRIVQKIQWISENQKEGEIRVQLKPENLGELLLRVSQVNDKVHVKLLAENIETQKLLQNHLFDLKDSLNLKQVKIDQILIGSLFEASGGDFDTQSRKGDEHRFFDSRSSEFFDQSSRRNKEDSEERNLFSFFEGDAHEAQKRKVADERDRDSLRIQKPEFSRYGNLSQLKNAYQKLNIRV